MMLSSGRKSGAFRRIDDNPAAREPFADIVVGVAFERQRDAFGQECAEALAGGTGEMEPDGILRQSRGSGAPGNFSAQHGADRAMHVADRQLQLDGGSRFQGIARVVDQLVVERLLQSMILRHQAAAPDASRDGRAVKDGREIDSLRFPVVDGIAHVQHVHPADHLVH